MEISPSNLHIVSVALRAWYVANAFSDYVFHLISEKIETKLYQQYARFVYMKIIVIIIPLKLVMNSYLFLCFISLKPKEALNLRPVDIDWYL